MEKYMKLFSRSLEMLNRGCAAAFATATILLPGTLRADQINANDFERSFTIKFPGYAGEETLTDFPALVRLSAEKNDFRYDKCQNGESLRFADADGNPIPHEIDTWDANGESLVWVKVPSLNDATTITAHYGWKGSGTIPENVSSNVWSNGYLGVWHMNETTLPMTDSSNGGTSLTENKSGATLPGQSGLVGNAVEFDKLSDHTGCLQTTNQCYKTSGRTDFTVEFWSYQDSFEPTVLSHHNTYMRENGSVSIWRAYGIKSTTYGSAGKTVVQVLKGDGTTDNPSTGNLYPLRGKWTYQYFRLDGTTQFSQGLNDNPRVYAKTYAAGITNDTADTTLYIGNTSSGSKEPFPGKIDEVRISSVARSDDWMKATYEMMTNESFAIYAQGNDWKKYTHTFSVSFPGATNGVLSAFPVLVKISPADIPNFRYADCLKPNGGDLRFADAAGNLLDSEVDTWDTNGVSLVWVNVPALSDGTAIKAYYGWEWAPEVNAKNVWTNGYLGVWHLNESGLTMACSTPNGIDFICNSSHADLVGRGRAGLVGNAVAFDIVTEGDNAHKGSLQFQDSSNLYTGLKTLTIELWLNQREMKGGRRIFYRSNNKLRAFDILSYYTPGNNYYKFGFSFGTTNTVEEAYKDISLMYQGEPGETNVWQHHAIVYDSVSTPCDARYYVDAISKSSATPLQDYITVPNGGSLLLGNLGGAQAFPGSIDEVRFSNVARSAEWLRTTYDMIQGNADFSTYGNAKANKTGSVVYFK